MKHTRSIMSIAMATIMVVSLCAVCASTSVSAAQSSSRASAQATPSLAGSPIAAGTAPSACILHGSDSMYIFVKGYDGALWYRIWNLKTDYWTGGWISLGGQLTSSPAAVSRQVGYMDVYVRGINGAVYGRSCYAGVWHVWTSLGGQVAPGTGPAASGEVGREDVFVQGTTGALYQLTWTSASGWSNSWVNLGGKLTSSPAAVSRQAGEAGNIEVCVRGTNGAVYEKAYYSGAWHDWYNVGGQVAAGTGPAICFYVYGPSVFTSLDVFVEGTNGALYQTTWTSVIGWSSWESLGGKLSAAPTAATWTFNGGKDMPVFVRGTNGLLYMNEYYSGAWHGWFGPYQGPP